MLLPAALSVRRADPLEVIGTALAAKAVGSSGYRTIAAQLGRPLSTVRRWLCRVPEKHAQWLYGQAVQRAFHLDPRDPGLPQAVSEHARLELEYLGRCRNGPPPLGGPRTPALDPDRALHPR